MATSNRIGVSSPREVSLIIGETLDIQGWGDGVFLNFRQEGNSVNYKEGAGGEVGVILSNNRTFLVDLNILQTSKDNSELSKLMQATQLLGTTYPVRLDDARGSTIGIGNGVLQKWPDAGFNKDDVEIYTWPLLIFQFELFLGGNSNG